MTIELSPMDYYFYRPTLYTIQFVFEYHYLVDVDDLRAALDLAARLFPVTSSRLRVISNMTIVFDPTHSQIPILTELLNEKPDPQDLNSLIDPILNTPSGPLVKFKISTFENMTYVGVSFSHILGDGASFLMFMKSISHFINKKPIDLIPDHGRRKLSRDLKQNERLDLFEKTGYVITTPEEKIGESETLFFSHETLSKLKANMHEKVTTNSLVMAILAKELNQKILRCPVDYREIYSQIDASYFGNAVRDAVVVLPTEPENLEIFEIALLVQKAISDIDEDSVVDSLSALNELRLSRGHSAVAELACPGLIVTNLTKFPFHEIDLGLGAPAQVHFEPQFPNLALLISHPDGIEVRIKNA